ncbi:penicillin-binding protein 2 [Thiorhodococcus mannitoliphagus]|uniref:Peptidoglycan D,D-transpeptidase FtsI n=1 Tax=Thiorhodococcus mannitoliphagus TaxID=329406 RepID=A0A6P1DQC3_9GAMM|nr:penicillin-binding protein 2 [Thiorhodococcus mannitoliphagus]NEX18866.1 penicillin-binding protein 2 [Thiorhodococcus mannitoliphagus]
MATHSRRGRRVASRRSKPNLVLRRRVLTAALSLAFVSLSAGVFYRQIIETDFLQEQGALRYLRAAEIAARRGMITDRNGEPLAVSTPVETVSANPGKLLDDSAAVSALAGALDMDAERLRAKVIANKDRQFIYVKRRVTLSEAEAVKAVVAERKLEGIGFEKEYRRYYPGAEFFAHVIGFTDIEDRGQEGIELAYDDALKAEPGLHHVIRDGRGRVVQEVEQIRPPRPGTDLTLSLDRRLQFLAHRELAAAVKEHRAKAGTAVVLDVATGEVLAMVNQPSFNPNMDRSGGSEQRRNRALTDVMEPGSTMKPLVVAAALEKRLISPRTPIATAPGYYKVGRNTVRDVHNYGSLDVTGVITKSSNVGVVKIAQRMAYSDLWHIYDQVGFGHPTGVGFPGESGGLLRHYSNWRPFEHATMAFGYGLSVTALQLAQAYSVIAADGVKRPVTLVKRDAASLAALKGTSVLSPATARKVRAMMETVVSDKGTAAKAQITGYRAAGKTGTAKKAGKSGYRGRRYQSVFAGFVPAGQPRLVMVVMIDEPGGKSYYGGTVAAPVFQKVMQGALRLFNIPPDDPMPSMLLAHRESAQ